ncbi:UNKNOWN [Stylonychia lemnae]|uniref:Uncharacterized protein n=1 Tax=Stylonychia lemnae TaxID=5949 RepID=A0A078AXT1_STYLE|nr:UNKNOWN [Stylonychia lemnae]|eukprot:CDW86042.1 UNKNOWN [Stylonychia lemnae]
MENFLSNSNLGTQFQSTDNRVETDTNDTSIKNKKKKKLIKIDSKEYKSENDYSESRNNSKEAITTRNLEGELLITNSQLSQRDSFYPTQPSTHNNDEDLIKIQGDIEDWLVKDLNESKKRKYSTRDQIEARNRAIYEQQKILDMIEIKNVKQSKKQNVWTDYIPFKEHLIQMFHHDTKKQQKPKKNTVNPIDSPQNQLTLMEETMKKNHVTTDKLTNNPQLFNDDFLNDEVSVIQESKKRVGKQLSSNKLIDDPSSMDSHSQSSSINQQSYEQNLMKNFSNQMNFIDHEELECRLLDLQEEKIVYMTTREKKKQLFRQQVKRHHQAVLQQQNNFDFIDVDLDEMILEDFEDGYGEEEYKQEVDHQTIQLQ